MEYDLVVVRRRQLKTGEWIFEPVDRESFGLLMDATCYGWFYADAWNQVKTMLEQFFVPCRLSNKWKDIVRCRELGF